MTVPADEARARSVLELVLSAPAPSRAAIIDSACASDHALRARVSDLLAQAEGAEAVEGGAATLGARPTIGVQAGPAGSSADAAYPPTLPPDLAAALAEETPGATLGPYKLLRLIGEGGFGSVWLADQLRPIVRPVALKIIKLGMDTRQVVARFEQERQALAILDHPHIAKVYDAGVTPSGRPYFVMELCKGEPIDAFCDRARLALDDRLALFLQVCSAVQHAHTKGVIHRDIKPSNILVSQADSAPAVKVIDFGVAKAVSGRMTDRTLITQHQQLIGTPEYMSPEQAEGDLDIDTRTDVYSLGVLLYELLTGATPFSGRELRSAAYADIQRIIRQVEPPRPSARLQSSAAALPDIAAQRSAEPQRLLTRVRGELDWIVMKAMEKDRARRYTSPGEFAADVERYLGGRAVLAAPPSRIYLARKFIRRNRAPVVAAGAAAAALVVGVIVTSLALLDSRRQRALAEERLAESEAVVGFIDEMFAAADPAALGRDVPVRAVLDRSAGTLDQRFADRPLVASRLHGVIGRTYLALGLYQPAEPHINRQLELRSNALGDDHEATRSALNDRAGLFLKQGDTARAEEILLRVVAENPRLLGEDHPTTCTAREYLAAVYITRLEAAKAEPLLRTALAGRAAAAVPDHRATLQARGLLALVLSDLRRFDEAFDLYDQSIALSERINGPDHPGTLTLRSDMAWALYWAASEASDPAHAKPLWERARDIGEAVLEARTRVLGEEHQDTLASLNNLASVYKYLGQNGRALELFIRGLDLSIRTLGENHPDTIVSLTNLGNTYTQMNRSQEALAYLERAVAAARVALPPGSPATAYPIGFRGRALRELGRFAEAEGPLIEAHDIFLKAGGPNDFPVLQARKGMVMLYEAWDRAEPGKGYADKAEQWKDKPASTP